MKIGEQAYIGSCVGDGPEGETDRGWKTGQEAPMNAQQGNAELVLESTAGEETRRRTSLVELPCGRVGS